MKLELEHLNWSNAGAIKSNQYTCGYCGNLVASAMGFRADPAYAGAHPHVYICPHCGRPSHISRTEDLQIPGVAVGNAVEHLPQDVGALYDEARQCMTVGAYTATVLNCRKLLMNIAVSQKAEEGKSFISYVEYLSEKGYVPPNGKSWVDHIRKKGNEANHEIRLMGQDDAAELIAFSEMLLKFIYEFPAKVPTTPQAENKS